MRAARFQDVTTFTDRTNLCDANLSKYPDRISVIIEPYFDTDPPITTKKFLILRTQLISRMINTIKDKIQTEDHTVLRFYVVKEAPPPVQIKTILSDWYSYITGKIADSTLVYLPVGYPAAHVYDRYRHEDGLLYIVYTIETPLEKSLPNLSFDSLK